ncbi:putative acetyltransferase [Acorus calamus]|uniref:Acetyltransferase n=1 Tax=Acorus calamus TaxID=4465 RepID=A0AAV9DFX7_ACOCL|nr:putative acetyltransferase [Acorus calamus]
MESRVNQISITKIKPATPSDHKPIPLSAWDLPMLTLRHIQKGLLFHHPSLPLPTISITLQTSLSATLRHFPPLAGRLFSEPVTPHDAELVSISIQSNDAGADFIHAVAEGVTVDDILTPLHVPADLVRSLFPHELAVNYDGHTVPLLSVQLTELVDGVFLGFSFNHLVGDGSSFWHFIKTWSDICKTGGLEEVMISRPVFDRWFTDGNNRIGLPLADPEKVIERCPPPPKSRWRIFHFSSDSIARLKAKANQESGATTTTIISSFQSLCVHAWICITRARRLPPNQKTSFRLSVDNRPRLRPRLSPDYFGNAISLAVVTATAGELLERGGFGWAARLLHETLAAHDDGVIREAILKWVAAPVVYRASEVDGFGVMVGSSPRFDMYGCDFGWGRAVGVRSGTDNKFNGKMTVYPGREGGGSVDLEICLSPERMAALEADVEFMSAVSP